MNTSNSMKKDKSFIRYSGSDEMIKYILIQITVFYLITTRGINLSTTKFSVLQGTCGLNFVREKIQTCILTCMANSISET